MSYSEQEQHHIERLVGRLETPNVLSAYRQLIGWLETDARLYVYPISRGAFSAIHVSTRAKARRYADCEFGFKGAKNHLRWYFRKPGFASGLVRDIDVNSHFECDTNLKAGEMMVNIHAPQEVAVLTCFLDTLLLNAK